MSNEIKNIKFHFDVDKNKYVLKIGDKVFEFSREESISLHNHLNRVLKATPILFN
ncbi:MULTISPECIES: hypothetical protein [Arcobacteraceae]|uniref:hypothetical protein n=1 Tax=Arcobacteraceae TaxID=2808963 RepID=UPI00081E1F9B|nr:MULTISPECIES: hypothetical protein [Arcobacteraceae]OCL81819.1 hypothetical protein AAW29_01794 [Arcobacter porcinus]OCL82321.1 hypothetical protein AAW30_01608 [Arcobacter porcinus]OCL90581.1 hypothetical protein AAX25_01679 [Aliarcobacter thereius]